MLSKKVILVDADFIDRVSFDFTVNFERMLERRIPSADLALWLDCIALDCGWQPGDNDIQVIFVYKTAEMKNFAPGKLADEIDGKAFKDNLGEFSMEAYRVEDSVTTLGGQMVDTMEVLLGADETQDIAVIGNMAEYGNLITNSLRENKSKTVTLFTVQPAMGIGFQQQQLGFSVVHALGVSGDELR